ncbi:sensor histidine kinase [Sphingopyxis panaciterrae]
MEQIEPRGTALYVDAVSNRHREMSPRERRAKIILTGAMWGANFAIFTLADALSGHPHLVKAAAVRLATFTFGIASCFGMHLLIGRLSNRSFRFRAITLGAVAPFAAETHAWFTFFAAAWLNHTSIDIVAIDWKEAMVILAMWTWFFLAWAGLYIGIEYSEDVKREERRSSELRSLAHAAKMSALHSQINPHFLFNSLNSVSSLILDSRSAEAERLLVALSAIFRRTLSTDPTSDIRLADEIDLQLSYLSIEKTRYPDLETHVDLPGNLKDAGVPALLLQPLVENAIKHGVSRSSPPTRIAIDARQEADMLIVSISNFGTINDRLPLAPGGGIGLRNVQDRLIERFGDRQAMRAGAYGADGYRVELHMPLVAIA